ncbi:MAG: hypothetical protein Q8916_12550 [Bacteroidota bacterium]|nr:hypothetical protein [Bacteroidota bacterium]MDP4231223.1 hypothetical protein [Bacteroidota bacterium]MDP4236996.1 hypothetical protein [Bacteroidota bacterium]
MNAVKPIWQELIEYARWTPSPHNVQPWRMKILSKNEAHLYYDSSRLLRENDPTSEYTILGFGMFIESLDIAARAFGQKIEAIHEAEERLDYNSPSPKLFARLFLSEAASQGDDYDPDLIRKRRTSRLHYDGKRVADSILNSFSNMASESGHTFTPTSDKTLLKFIIGLNSITLFSDLENDKGRDELRGWIRPNRKLASAKRDGLWSQCMRFPGWVMKNFFFHHEWFHASGIRKILGWVYDRSMKGTATVAWISGAFGSRSDCVAAGRLMQRLWLEATKHNVYFHPFGSLISNPESNRMFLNGIGFNEEKEKLWFLLRLGYSSEPPRSFRLRTEEILL